MKYKIDWGFWIEAVMPGIILFIGAIGGIAYLISLIFKLM